LKGRKKSLSHKNILYIQGFFWEVLICSLIFGEGKNIVNAFLLLLLGALNFHFEISIFTNVLTA